ncbi:MAG: Ger(x)C family spore germination protein [Acidobacteriota bacterium]
MRGESGWHSIIFRRYAAIISLMLCLFSAGCWDRHEIEKLGFVLVAGLDIEKNQNMTVTVQIAKPFTIAGGFSRPQTDERPFWLVSSSGTTVFEAIRGFFKQSPRRLFWGHNRFVIIGEDLARSGVHQALDIFDREGEPRRREEILIAKGKRASDLMQSEFELERLPMEGFEGISENVRQGLSTSLVVSQLEFKRALEGEGIEPVASGVTLIRRPVPAQDVRGYLKDDIISYSAAYDGAAAFKEDRLVGWLNTRQTRGLNWISNRARGGIVTVKRPHHPEEKDSVNLEVIRSHSRIIPLFENNHPKIEIKITAEGNLDESQKYLDPLNDSTWKALEAALSAHIKNEAEAAVTQAQSLNTDIMGFGRAFYCDKPAAWYGDLKQNWYDIFPTLEVQITVEAKLRRTGLLVRTLTSH